MNSNQNNINKIGGIYFVGCMFLGAGIGYLFNDFKAGGAIGMGIGFLAMATVLLYYRNR